MLDYMSACSFIAVPIYAITRKVRQPPNDVLANLYFSDFVVEVV
jgi:hypothetical protein